MSGEQNRSTRRFFCEITKCVVTVDEVALSRTKTPRIDHVIQKILIESCKRKQ